MNKVDPESSKEKELEERVAARTRELDEVNQKLNQARNLFYALFHANPIPTSLTHLEDGLFIDANDAYPDLPCVMLSGHISPPHVRSSLKAGARGYPVKDRAEGIPIGIRRVREGELYTSEELRSL